MISACVGAFNKTTGRESAKKHLNWEPTIVLREGLKPMVEDFKKRILYPGEDGDDIVTA